MDTVQLVPPVGGNRTRRGRRFLCLLLAVLLLGLALPAQAGLSDLIDDLLNPVDDLPIIDEVLDPVLEIVDPVVDLVAPVVDPLGEVVDPIVGGGVDPVLDQIVMPVVEEVVQPILEEVVPPLVEDPVPPPVEEIVPPPLDDLFPPIGSVVDPGGSAVAGPASPGNESARTSEPTSQFESSPGNVDAGESLVLAHSLQSRLAVDGQEAKLETGTSSRVAETRIHAASIGWLDGLTDWLRSAADGLLGLLTLPVRLFEILIRALLTAGSGLVAPASLLLVFTAYAIRDRRSGRVQINHSAA